MSTCRALLQPLQLPSQCLPSPVCRGVYTQEARGAKHICSLPSQLPLTCHVVLICRRVDTQEAHAERAQLRQQLDRAYDVLKFKRTEERNLTQDVAMVSGCELETTSLVVDEA